MKNISDTFILFLSIISISPSFCFYYNIAKIKPQIIFIILKMFFNFVVILYIHRICFSSYSKVFCLATSLKCELGLS